MAKTHRFPDPYASESESFGDTLRNLGVTVERPNREEITGVKWVDKPNTHKTTHLITVTEKGVYFPCLMRDLTKATMGAGKYKGQTVLVIKPDPKGYKISKLTGRGTERAGVSVKRVVNTLLAAGLKTGVYKPVKIKVGWMGVPVE